MRNGDQAERASQDSRDAQSRFSHEQPAPAVSDQNSQTTTTHTPIHHSSRPGGRTVIGTSNDLLGHGALHTPVVPAHVRQTPIMYEFLPTKARENASQ
jgi:hypothetical protein